MFQCNLTLTKTVHEDPMLKDEHHGEKCGPTERSWSPNRDSMSEEDPRVLRFTRRVMQDAFQMDPKLLEKFFPIQSAHNENYQEARKQWFNERTNRWKRIPNTPTPFSRIYTPLTNLLNGILHLYGIQRDRRLFIDGHVRRPNPKRKEILPAISLAGAGPEFANNSEPLPRDIFTNYIAVIEVVLDSDDMTAARDRLAVHMHWLFQGQDNRRFAFGLILTPNAFTLFIFDHSGAVASEPCNYHVHPEQFCSMIAGMADAGEKIGFDHTLLSGNDLTKFRTFQKEDDGCIAEIQYFAISCLFRFSSLVGRGTMCWRTSRLDDPQSTFVIKDAWIGPSDPPGRESEASLLRYAQSRGIETGIAKIHHFEEVRRSDTPSDLDTILRNRKIENTSPESSKLERLHIRLVMTPCGKTLDRFSNRKELIFAFYDAVLAHRKLHDVAGILHRDISCSNILINADGVEGDRGILIDFDHSIRVDDTSPYSTKPGIGTWRFRSRRVLQGHIPHTYLDDLESFFYVLCWILGAFERAGVIKAELPHDLNFWDLPTSYELKTGYLIGEFDLPISTYFGTSFATLATNLHNFFADRLRALALARNRGLEHTKEEPEKDYNEFISYIKQAIVGIETEECGATTYDMPDSHSGGISQKLKRKHTTFEADKIPVKAARLTSLLSPGNEMASFGRPRRSTANYGYPSVQA